MRGLATSYAQTNLQLYAQMFRADYGENDVDRVRAAYEFTLPLFSGAYRGSGKPFIAHLVGTASILASVRARPPVVAAGLLHAVYASGEFGNGWGGEAPWKRARLADAVGAEIEDLVTGYTTLRWNAQTIPVVHGRLDTMDGRERDVLLVRLANELEDHLDLGVLYCGNAERRREYVRSSLYRCIDMAVRLGFPELASELDGAFKATLAEDVPVAFRRGENESFRLAPTSHGLRLAVRLRRLLARLPLR
jgi:(p)ppGpp synthase/HD superfamily hydrolase